MHLHSALLRRLPALFCAAALAFFVLVAGPVAEMGLADDWSYIYSARQLADTGHIIYNGWATAMEGWQLVLGALFIKGMGFSFTAPRMSVLLVGMVTAFLLQRILVRTGVHEWNATLGTLTLVLSPLFLPLSISFMTDIPGLFCLVLCLYCCLRALQAANDTGALFWLIFAAVSNMVSGTVRQTAWLGVLVMVPSTVWLMRRRRGALLTGAVLWIAGIAVIAGCLTWFSHQPYAITEKLISKPPTWEAIPTFLFVLARNLLAGCLYLAPILAGFAVAFPFRNRRAALSLVLCLSALSAFVVTRVARGHDVTPFLAPFSENCVTARGLLDFHSIEGVRPTVLSIGTRSSITLVVAFVFVCFLVSLFSPAVRRRSSVPVHSFSWRDLLVLLGPVAGVYFLLLLPRAAVRGIMYDRYMLPLILFALAPLLLLYQERMAERLPTLSVLLLLAISGFGVAATHDLFAFYRARLVAVNEVRSAGVPRPQIRGGWEYDGWTQIEETGYVNEPTLKVPAGAYHPPERRDPGGVCPDSFYSFLPSIQPLYTLSYDPSACLGPSQFEPVQFHTWLAPHEQTIYVVRMR